MTAHQARIEQVRNRLAKAIKYVPQERRRGGLTPWGNFAEKLAAIAKETKGGAPWKTTDFTKGGAPKDLSTALRRLSEGRQGMSGTMLDLVEATCLHYEMEHRQALTEGRATKMFLTEPAEEVAGAPAPHPGDSWVEEPAKDEDVPVRGLLTRAAQALNGIGADANPDPEINAMFEISSALNNLDSDARTRVLSWAEARYGT
jgi:hypothetical protein